MKKFFKFGCLGIIGIIILGIVIAALGGGDDSTSTDNSNSGGSGSSDSGSTSEKEEQTYAIGDTVDVGDMTYTINGKSTAQQVGPSTLPEEANGMYVVLDVTVKNNGNEAVTVDGSYFKLKQGETTFEADSGASMSANQGEDGTIQNSFFMEQLNPSSEMSGKVVFDVAPEIAEADNLKVQAQEGMFGSVSKTIQLQ
ncbi:DUF4352 domain-containing protein [Salimicrobium halophilum]|uniref:DUF4352 domain-containing protein n=1 Tax=Salimicrobium halophilum TaxID=86666 RepID=A0A1G8QWY9_9BACI|nr:DUF4352 domain-containing protein [Salimicrobium halophilum]SDJ08690.1 protein of unknown function [Salimicrobium halophilum]